MPTPLPVALSDANGNARTNRTVSSLLYDVNGNVITSLSDATVLVGYSDPIDVFGADAIIFEVKDTGAGTVAPTAYTVEGRSNGVAATYATDLNFLGVMVSAGQAANFAKSPAARIAVVPQIGGVYIAGLLIYQDQIRLKITRGAGAALFTPVITAYVLKR
jgi:hypothetical protein